MVDEQNLGRNAVNQTVSLPHAWQAQPANMGCYQSSDFQEYNYNAHVNSVKEESISTYAPVHGGSYLRHMNADLYSSNGQPYITSQEQSMPAWQQTPANTASSASETIPLTSGEAQGAVGSLSNRNGHKEESCAAGSIAPTSMHATPYLPRDTCSKLMLTPSLAQDYQTDFESESYTRGNRSGSSIVLTQQQNSAAQFDIDSVLSHRQTSQNQFLVSTETNHLNANNQSDNIENSVEQSRQPIATPSIRQDHTYEQHGAPGLSYPTTTATTYSNYESQQNFSQSYYPQSITRVTKGAQESFCYTDNKQMNKGSAIINVLHSSSMDKFAPPALSNQSSHLYEAIRSGIEPSSGNQAVDSWPLASTCHEPVASTAVNLNKQHYLDLTPASDSKSNQSELSTKYQVYHVSDMTGTGGQYSSEQVGSNGGLNLSHSLIESHVAYQSSFALPTPQFSVSH